jgi:hypothetical protein
MELRGTDILSDIVLKSVFDHRRAQKEQGVVLEEILMNEDYAEDVASEESNMSFFEERVARKRDSGHIRTASARLRGESLFVLYKTKTTCPPNIVVAWRGGILTKRRLVETCIARLISRQGLKSSGFLPSVGGAVPGSAREVRFVEKDVEQVHLSA